MRVKQVMRMGALGLSLWVLLSLPSAAQTKGEQQSRLVNFSVENSMGLAPLTVVFTNESTVSGSGLVYLWNFGDGETSSEEHPIHIYETSGTYDVSLTVTSSEEVHARTKADAIEAHNIFMFADFEDPLLYDEFWVPSGPVHWTNTPALVGSGSMAVDINTTGTHAEMQGDDGIVVAGGGSGSGCPIPPLNCRDDVDTESYGTFSFYFDVGGVVAGGGSDFYIFRLSEGYATGPALVDVVVNKVGGEFFLQYVVSQTGGAVVSSLVPFDATSPQFLEISWVSGSLTTSGLGQFHAKLSNGNLITNESTSTLTSIFNLDNSGETFDYWQLGMFQSFFNQTGSGQVVFDHFLAERSVSDRYGVDFAP